jgi:cobaltochelatase CobS
VALPYVTAQDGKYELVHFLIFNKNQQQRIVRTIRHRRNGNYYPYAVTYKEDGKQVYDREFDYNRSDSSTEYAPCHRSFGKADVFDPVNRKFQWRQYVSEPTNTTIKDMAIFILEREDPEVLKVMYDSSICYMFRTFAFGLGRYTRNDYEARATGDYYKNIPRDYYSMQTSTILYASPRPNDPWTDNKAVITKGNIRPSAFLYKPQQATSQGGEPMTQRPADTSMIDNALIKELKDAIKSIAKKPTVLEEKLLEAVIEKTKDLATAELEAELRTRLEDFISKTYGSLPTRMDIKIGQEHKGTMTGIFHEKLPDILTMLANNIPVMLTGPAGSGKNYSLEQAAKAMEIEFYYTGAITQEYKLTGFIDAGGRYHETEFYKAFKNGGLFMLDEVDASSPETLVILNGAIANRYFDFPNGRIHAHEEFRIACAGNTYGTGADMIYVGRNVLDGATLDRFAVIRMDYDTNVEKQLCPDTEFFDFIQSVRKTVYKVKLRHIVGMRASINGYRSLMAGMSKQFILESIVLKGLGVDDLNTLISNMDDSAKATDWGRELGKYHSLVKKGAR